MNKLYYTAPSDTVFNEVRDACVEVWEEMLDGGNDEYISEKISRVREAKNVEDNFMSILAIFDITNQSKVVKKLSPKAYKALFLRLLAGGAYMEIATFSIARHD